MIHVNDGRDAFGCAYPEDRNGQRIRNGVPIERKNLKRVAGQCQTANLSGTPVQDVKEHSFALLYPDRFTVAEHSPVYGEGAIANFEAMWHALGERRLHG